MRTFRDKAIETSIVFILALIFGSAGYATGYLIRTVFARAEQTRCHNQCDQTSDEGFACKKMCKVKGDCPHWED